SYYVWQPGRMTTFSKAHRPPQFWSASMQREVTPRLAATTILVRARGTQPEILLLKRGEHARFMPNAYVFAGGALDPKDESAEVRDLCAGLDDRSASERLQLPSNGLPFFVAAVREAFEE